MRDHRGTIVSLQICPGHREPMQMKQSVRAIAGLGLQGDRHAYPNGSRQVLLIEEETLKAIDLKPGMVKENVTTRGIDMQSLARGARLRIGGALFEITTPCTPCERMDEIRAGLRQALEGRRGMLARVVEGGMLQVGDTIEVINWTSFVQGLNFANRHVEAAKMHLLSSMPVTICDCTSAPWTMKRSSTIIFDVGGTLLRFNLDALAQAYIDAAAPRGLSLDFAQTRTAIQTLERELPERSRHRLISLENDDGKSFWDGFYAEGFDRVGVPGDVSAAAAGIRERFQRGEFETVHADVIPALDALAARGVPLGILSNFSRNCEDVLRRVGVHHYFGFFVVSAIAGVEKPDARIFDLAVRAADRPRDEIVYVGDSIFHDTDGAQRAGIAAILVDRADQHPDYPGARVRDLRELIRPWEKE